MLRQSLTGPKKWTAWLPSRPLLSPKLIPGTLSCLADLPMMRVQRRIPATDQIAFFGFTRRSVRLSMRHRVGRACALGGFQSLVSRKALP